MSHSPWWFSISAGLFLVVLVAIASLLSWRARNARPRVVCFGDSLTSCGGVNGRYSDFLARALAGVAVINKGVSGETLADGRCRFQRDVLELRPVVLVIAMGANDWKRNERPVEALREDLAFMVRSAREAGIGIVIAGTFGPHPDPAGRALRERHKGQVEFADAIFRMECEVAREFGCGHVENMQVDLNTEACWDYTGHPSPEGNRRVAERILPLVLEALERANCVR